MILSHALRAVRKVPSVSYITTIDNATDLTTYTFTAANIGGPGLIVVAAHTERSGTVTISSASIGGVSSTINRQETSTLTGGVCVCGGLFSSVITSGSTADIVITFSAQVLRCGIAIYRITDYTSATPVDTIGQTNTTASGLSGDINNVRRNDVIIGAYVTGVTQLVTWSNITERYDQSIGGEATQESGGDAISTVNNSYTISTSHTSSNQGLVLLGAAWR